MNTGAIIDSIRELGVDANDPRLDGYARQILVDQLYKILQTTEDELARCGCLFSPPKNTNDNK